MLLRFRASFSLISPFSHACTIAGKSSGASSPVFPNELPGLWQQQFLQPAAFYIHTFIFAEEGQYLQNQISDEGSHQTLAIPGVHQRHVDHADVSSDVFRQNTPLFLYLLIVPAQPVNAENVQQIAILDFVDHFLILRTLEVLPGLLVNEQVALCTSFYLLLPRYFLSLMNLNNYCQIPLWMSH